MYFCFKLSDLIYWHPGKWYFFLFVLNWVNFCFSGSLLSGMFKSETKNPFQCMPPLDAESHQLSVLSLRCLAQLLSWIPLSSYITSSLLTTVFHFASFGCHPEPVSIDVCFFFLSGDSSLVVVYLYIYYYFCFS